MMTNKGNYLAAADHELECDILQVGELIEILTLYLLSGKHCSYKANKLSDL